MGRRQPCVRAFSRVVPVWKPGCGQQAWCISHERRYVPGSRSRVGVGALLAPRAALPAKAGGWPGRGCPSLRATGRSPLKPHI